MALVKSDAFTALLRGEEYQVKASRSARFKWFARDEPTLSDCLIPYFG
jgi:hypothetical protein